MYDGMALVVLSERRLTPSEARVLPPKRPARVRASIVE